MAFQLTSGFRAISQFPGPNRAILGDYFRGASFLNGDKVLWREATEINGHNKWKMVDCSMRLGGDSDEIKRTIAAWGPSVSLWRAIQAVAQSEEPSFLLGKYHDDPESLGNDHVRSFAGRNGFVFDVNNKPHVLYNGRPITSGEFSEQEIKIANKRYEDAKKEPVLALETGRPRTIEGIDMSFSIDDLRLRNSQKVTLDSFKELEESKNRLLKIFTDLLDVVDEVFQVHFYRFSSMNIVEYGSAEKSFEKLIRSYFDSLSENETIKYKNFLKILELSIDVSYTKECYGKYSVLCGSERAAKSSRRAFNKSFSEMNKTLKKLKASPNDCHAIHKYIVNGGKNETFSYDSALAGFCGMAMLGKYYFIPQEIETFLTDMKTVMLDLDKRINSQSYILLADKKTGLTLK